MTTGAGYPDFEPPRTPPEPHPVAPPAFGPGPTGPAPPPVGRRRTLAVVLVTLLAGLALVVAADRLAPRVVGDRLAATVQTALDLDQRPVVRLTGFPFLTQVASRHYRKISITARDVPVPNTGHGLEIAELDATLADVRPNLTYSSFGIGDLTGSATIDYATVSTVVGIPVSYERSTADGFITLQLGSVTAVTGKPTLDRDGVLYLDQASYTVDGRRTSGDVMDRLFGDFFRVPLPPLASGLEWSGARADAQGIVLAVSGTDITLTR